MSPHEIERFWGDVQALVESQMLYLGITRLHQRLHITPEPSLKRVP